MEYYYTSNNTLNKDVLGTCKNAFQELKALTFPRIYIFEVLLYLKYNSNNILNKDVLGTCKHAFQELMILTLRRMYIFIILLYIKYNSNNTSEHEYGL